jgi:hypothetical protein
MVEVSSIQLTALALKKAKESALQSFTQSQDRLGPSSAPISASRDRVKARRLLLQLHEFDKELSRRKMALLYNLVRSPIFDR